MALQYLASFYCTLHYFLFTLALIINMDFDSFHLRFTIQSCKKCLEQILALSALKDLSHLFTAETNFSRHLSPSADTPE